MWLSMGDLATIIRLYCHHLTNWNATLSYKNARKRTQMTHGQALVSVGSVYLLPPSCFCCSVVHFNQNVQSTRPSPSPFGSHNYSAETLAMTKSFAVGPCLSGERNWKARSNNYHICTFAKPWRNKCFSGCFIAQWTFVLLLVRN